MLTKLIYYKLLLTKNQARFNIQILNYHKIIEFTENDELYYIKTEINDNLIIDKKNTKIEGNELYVLTI